MRIQSLLPMFLFLMVRVGMVAAGNPPIVVDRADGDDGWWGCTEAPEDCSFLGALHIAAPGDVIAIGVPTMIYDSVAINKSVTIQANAADLPRLEVGAAPGAPVNLTVLQGHWYNRTNTLGGAMLIHPGHTVTLYNAVFQGNKTTNGGAGGAIHNAGHLTVSDSRFTGNHAYFGKGGAIFSSTTSNGTVHPTLIIARSLFENNYSQSGAAVIHNEGLLDITASRFFRNGTLTVPSGHPPFSHFGAIQNLHKVTIRDSLFESNEALYASCIQSTHELVVANTTFTRNNSLWNQEGGVFLLGGKATLANVTAIGNFALQTGGMTIYGGSNVELINTVIAQNTGGFPDVLGSVHLLGPNLLGSTNGTTVTGATQDLIIASSARIMGLAPNGGPMWTMRPHSDSPVINRGSSCVATGSACGAVLPIPPLVTDQRGPGFVRNRGGAVDLGAFELPAELVINSQDAGAGSLRDALQTAAAGDYILFHPSFLSATQTIQLQSPLVMTAPGEIVGPGSARLTIDGGDTVRVLDINAPGPARISGLRFANGRAPVGADGGALRHQQGSLEIDDVRFEQSIATRGGCLASAAQLSMTNAWFDQCEANSGGAVFISGSDSATLAQISMTDNLATTNGGAIRSTGSLTMWGSTISHNQAQTGGALHLAGFASLENLTISSNSVALSGGGIYVDSDASVTLSHVTVAANTATGFGGGIHNGGGVLNLRTTIVGDNTAAITSPDVHGVVRSHGHNLIGSTLGNSFDGNSPSLIGNHVDVPVRLHALAAWNGEALVHAPMYDSPAIDGAGTGAESAVDQIGFSRVTDFTHIDNAVQGAGADIGAIELSVATPDAVIAEPGDAVVQVTFSSGSRGGMPIGDHRVSCGAAGLMTTSSPVPVHGVPNGVPVFCTVIAFSNEVYGVPSAPSATVIPHEPLAILSDAPGDGIYGASYHHASVISGVSSGIWSIAIGQLPPGLSLDINSGPSVVRRLPQARSRVNSVSIDRACGRRSHSV